MVSFQQHRNNLRFVQPKKEHFVQFRTVGNDTSTPVQIFASAPVGVRVYPETK